MRYIIVIAIIIFATSCSVKKRTYRNGYYVDWAFNKKKSITPEATPLLSEKPSSTNSIKVNSLIDKEDNASLTSAESKIEGIIISKEQKLTLLNDTCGDKIFFKSGDIVVAKVTEITEDNIKYKRCDNLDGPQFVVSKSRVMSIRYTNGLVEDIEPSFDKPSNNINQPISTDGKPKRIHPKAIWALIFALLGIFPLVGIGFIISLILSLIAVKEIRLNPKVYKGIILASVVRNISLVICGIIALAIILAIING